MRKYIAFIFAALSALVSCSPKYGTRVEKLLAELNDPDSKYVFVACHRGDWRNYPENSIPAMESVIRMGADIMELDVKMTKDSQLVVCHDRTLSRTTNIHPDRDPSYPSAKISDLTLEQIKALKLRRSQGVTTDSLRVPTLEEALAHCKDRILVNLDGGIRYYDMIMEIGERLGMTEQLFFKGGRLDYVAECLTKSATKPLYMPIVSPMHNNDIDKFIAFGKENPECKPFAYELCYGRDNSPEDYREAAGKVIAAGSRAWVNTLWSTLSGLGWDDDAAFAADDPGDVYGPILDTGVSMIQTDRPELLLSYLRRIGRHD